MVNSKSNTAAVASIQKLSLEQFDTSLKTMSTARSFAKSAQQNKLLSLAKKLLKSDGGAAALYPLAAHFDTAGLFWGSDWENPQHLQPALVRGALLSADMLAVIECLSELRLLAIARGDCESEQMTSVAAREFLEDVLARNLDLLFPSATEASREQAAPMADTVQQLFAFIVERLGAAGVLQAMIEEADRVLLQRPVMTERVVAIVHAAKQMLGPADHPNDVCIDESLAKHARLLINAIEAPTILAHEHPDSVDYAAALAPLSAEALAAEARLFGESMDATGLVAPLHATLLQHLVVAAPESVADALALRRVGRTSLAEYPWLVAQLIKHAVLPETARCIYGLSRLLERGIVFYQPVVPGLWRLMLLPIQAEVAERLQSAFEGDTPPSASALLVSGALSVLGQPRGVDQGHNPTCQAARAISLWSQNDVGYLLELVACAARDANVVMHFEGEAIRSSELSFGLAKDLHPELDPVSLVLTPHLDKIYMEMSRRTIGRGEDGHKWVNPELHGWWVCRGFAELVDPVSDAIHGFDEFMRRFYAAYHPQYNGGGYLVYAQPCGVAVTNHNGEFVGWHAVSIQRVQADPDGIFRVYFYNPNRDKGQNWGLGVVTSTCDHGEQEGESSLPFEQFASRLYVYHYKARELGNAEAVPQDIIEGIRSAVAASWAQGRAGLDER